MILTDEQRDALLEVINIAFGRAAASLSELTGQRVLLTVPKAAICPIHELVEKIAHDNNLSTELVESLENSSHTWIEEFFSGLGHQDRTTSEMAVFRRVVSTVHALAQCGHIILVGLGGVLITRHRKGGIHFRLVAPLEYRVAHLARQDGISLDEARRKVPLLDQNRRAYHHRFWPDEPLVPEMFHLTLNSGLLSEEQMVECILPTLWGPNGI